MNSIFTHIHSELSYDAEILEFRFTIKGADDLGNENTDSSKLCKEIK